MRFLVSGSSGLVGSALVSQLTTRGHIVVPLTRGGAPGGIAWDPAHGILDPRELDGIDVVIHLAGESIAQGRWTTKKKARIRDSRVTGTRRLCESLLAAASRPRVMVCASAVGYYGDRGVETLVETSAPGAGFLPDVCIEWEQATTPIADSGVRVVNLRFGIILSTRGGALAKMLTPFRLGLGGRIGSGRQYMSWFSIDDAVGAIQHAVDTDALSGGVNGVAPAPVTNAEFTATLAGALSRPAVFPMPAFAARLAFGEMADALLLSSCRAIPRRLEQTGYVFRHPALEDALHALLRRT